MIERLRNSLETGYIDKDYASDYYLQPSLIVNDRKRKRKVLSQILNELSTCDHFIFSVAFLTKSGVATILNALVEAGERGVSGQVLVSQYLNFTEPEALKTMMQLRNVELKIVTKDNFHAKGYFFKKGSLYSMIVGSSNLTAPALTSNKEWNLLISGMENSKIIVEALNEFKKEFNKAEIVTAGYINYYTKVYKHQKTFELVSDQFDHGYREILKPNVMQIAAMRNLESIRQRQLDEGSNDKALIISATGTGKTYLSVFDVQNYNPKRMLFVVHRLTIAKAAMRSYEKVFGTTKSMGLFSGNTKNISSDFIFSTVQTISKEKNMLLFDQEEFDYIIIDESHRSGAASYQKIINYFKPNFLLGMTATPERMDGYNIFDLFDYNIAYEVRLNEALEEKMLCPFHYYGITDFNYNGEEIETETFNLLSCDSRVDHIIEKINFYGTDDGTIKGLVFTHNKKTCKELSDAFNLKGFRSVSLTGINSESQREEAIKRLELEEYKEEKLDFIFTVDIFNEGVDIPKVNLVVMLRPTESATIFIQQLGRGLRKEQSKEYLTVLDFIGNYNKNYLIPVALYGDASFSKDNLRKMISTNSAELPGASTVNFDIIAKQQIYNSIDSANLKMKKDLDGDYAFLKYKIGQSPMMMDFIEHGSRSPSLYAEYSKCYYSYVKLYEKTEEYSLDVSKVKVLEYLSAHIADGKRILESEILMYLIESKKSDLSLLTEYVNSNDIDITYSALEILSGINNLGLSFFKEKENNKMIGFGEKYKIDPLVYKNSEDEVLLSKQLIEYLKDDLFKIYFLDNIKYGTYKFKKSLSESSYHDGFILYNKYTRKDVFRILCWNENPIAQNVGGYILSKDRTNCPAFINYHKEEGISDTTKYEDKFINPSVLQWMSKSRRNLDSPDVKAIRSERNMRTLLFIKKHNDEGAEFYYMGDLKPRSDTFEQMQMSTGDNKLVSVVKMMMTLDTPVELDMYHYITHDI